MASIIRTTLGVITSCSVALKSKIAARQRTYTRAQITQMWNLRRQGKINDADWARWEHELIAAGRENRILGALAVDDVDGVRTTRWPFAAGCAEATRERPAASVRSDRGELDEIAAITHRRVASGVQSSNGRS